MIKGYMKIIVMSVTLILLLVGFVSILTKDIDLGFIKNLAVANISEKKVAVDTLIAREKIAKQEHENILDSLENSKNQYEAAKQAYENISDATIDMVLEATKDERYFIEYLWIVLGNYADENGLSINIITPGSTASNSGTTVNDGENEEDNANKAPQVDVNVVNDAIKIIVKGRYSNVADFVYEVENDKELKFKLDNIKMVYTKDNAIEATFNVLSLKVRK